MVEVTVKETSTFKPITLDLDAKETEFLMRLLGYHVAGTSSWGNISDNLYEAMYDAMTPTGENLDVQPLPHQVGSTRYVLLHGE